MKGEGGDRQRGGKRRGVKKVRWSEGIGTRIGMKRREREEGKERKPRAERVRS